MDEGIGSALHVFGVTLIGATPENGRKLLLTLLFVAAILLIGWIARSLLARVAGRTGRPRVVFWARQSVNIAAAFLVVLVVLSIWFDDPTRLATALGLVTAGLAFALQRVITAFAGYVVILRGRTFNVGDRIVMGGVRGDVLGLSFMQTEILEMGQPPTVQEAEPAMWVRARQYTGRIVTVTNAKVFDEPVYNYTREFPFLWEELVLPIRYGEDRGRAEEILMEVGRRHTEDLAALGKEALSDLQRRYYFQGSEVNPRVYWRLTDNWIELTLRFLAREHGVREVKDRMSREILERLDAAGIGIASATFEIVGLPKLRLEGGGRNALG